MKEGRRGEEKGKKEGRRGKGRGGGRREEGGRHEDEKKVASFLGIHHVQF